MSAKQPIGSLRVNHKYEGIIVYIMLSGDTSNISDKLVWNLTLDNEWWVQCEYGHQNYWKQSGFRDPEQWICPQCALVNRELRTQIEFLLDYELPRPLLEILLDYAVDTTVLCSDN